MNKYDTPSGRNSLLLFYHELDGGTVLAEREHLLDEIEALGLHVLSIQFSSRWVNVTFSDAETKSRAQKLLLSRPLRSLDLSLSLDLPEEGCSLAPEPSLSLSGLPSAFARPRGRDGRRSRSRSRDRGERLAIARRSVSLSPERLAAKEDTVVGTPMTRERSRSLFESGFDGFEFE